MEVVIVGDAPAVETTAALHAVEEILGRDVNPSVHSPRELLRKLKEALHSGNRCGGGHFPARVRIRIP
jgi:hypothetical protein